MTQSAQIRKTDPLVIAVPYRESSFPNKITETPVQKAPIQVNEDPLSIDEIIDRALGYCVSLPHSCDIYINQIEELKTRLSRGKLHLAVLGQFNRGKSTFLNALIGIKVLPTSVLPITSVPTIISYSSELSCIVRFLDKKPDLIVKQSLESIRETLKKYVSEQNNPNNQLCVKEVEVTCPSSLLENGTVLIDTPGFGSTHIHNTRVALTTLTECDAAIFLLSADPPLTQTELEFLKQVNKYIPRLFFVLNKIDLLSTEDLSTIDQFIKDVLIVQMQYPADLELFHICAIKAEKASGNMNHESWLSSGMNSVKTKILDFMIREKYFTLSQALNEKFREALSNIENCLNEEYRNLNTPVDLLKRENNDLQEQVNKLRKICEKEIGLVSIEENAVINFLNQQVTGGILSLQQQMLNDFDDLASKSPLKTESIKTLTALFSNIIIGKLESFFLSMINQCNKPIRKATQIHTHEFGKFFEGLVQILGEKNTLPPQSIDHLNQCEIEFTQWVVDGVVDCTIQQEWNDRLRNKSSLVDRYKKQLETQLNAVLTEQIGKMKIQLESQIHDIFSKIHDLLEREYGVLTQLLEISLKKKDTAITDRVQNSSTQSLFLQTSIENFKAVKNMLL